MKSLRITENEALLMGNFRLAFGERAVLNGHEQAAFVSALREGQALVDDVHLSPLLAREYIGRSLIAANSDPLTLIGTEYLNGQNCFN